MAAVTRDRRTRPGESVDDPWGVRAPEARPGGPHLSPLAICHGESQVPNVSVEWFFHCDWRFTPCA